MTTKDYLNQISRFNRMINNKLTEITQLRELSCSISAIRNEEKIKSSSDPDKIGSTYAKIDEMERNLDKMIDEYIEKKNLIIGQIDGIEDEKLKKILYLHYIEFISIAKIANILKMTRRGCQKAHGRALIKFEKILEKDNIN